MRAIAAGCPPGGLVCDPFSGVATTGLAALHLGRRYLGIDINPSYHDLAFRRFTPLLDTNPPNGAQP
jgi:DNA modification methylase